ncbi:hypothetical protein [Streptomyces sp. NPDC093970]|uniref:hypothetical protein n=1 Tax=Streptomyces sp. NPDC093970 TaxID=3155076 RepID=UPI00342F2FEA
MIDGHIHLWGAAVAAAPCPAGERTASIRRPAAFGEYAAAAWRGGDAAVVDAAAQSAAGTARLVAARSREPLVSGVVGTAADRHGPIA